MPAPDHHHLVLTDWQADNLAELLDSLHLWLSEAPARTLHELADHTDPCWSNTPGSELVYAQRFIARLQRCRSYLNPTTEDAYRPPNVTQTPDRGVNFQPLQEGQFSAVVDNATSRRWRTFESWG